jgi:hypothetical protein
MNCVEIDFSDALVTLSQPHSSFSGPGFFWPNYEWMIVVGWMRMAIPEASSWRISSLELDPRPGLLA